MHPLKMAIAASTEHGAIQKAAEFANFLAMAADIEPKVIMEIGSAGGGTIWAWQQLGPDRVIAIDLPDIDYDYNTPLDSHGAELILGDSHAQETLDELVALLGGDPIDVLFIDGDHHYEGVKRDWEMYSPLVRPGGLVAFHDICNHPTPGFEWVQVQRFWLTLTGDKEEIVTVPYNWGGIGVVRMPALVPA